MPAPSEITRQSTPSSTVQLSPEKSFRLFASSLLRSSAIAARSTGEEVVFDIEVEGHRFLLVHMPVVERSTPELSPREIEIVRMVALGHPNKVIADVLGISCWTVGTYLRRIFAKLGVGSRAAMIARLAHIDGAHDQRSAWGKRDDVKSSASQVRSFISTAAEVSSGNEASIWKPGDVKLSAGEPTP
jgi:DNA-binding CsgD family transcriptional regulator